MADSSRQEKLASAKRKLKQFQQRKTPQNSPSSKQSTTHNISFNSKDTSFESQLPSSFQSQVTSPQVLSEKTDKSKISTDSNETGDDIKINGIHQIVNLKEGHHVKKTRSSPTLQSQNDDSRHHPRIESTKPNEQSYDEIKFSPAEKIKQISNQLNGLITKDILLNADNEIIKEISALAQRNSELEDNLQSCRRSNKQLTNQLNEQRKHILQYQEKLKKDKSDPSPKQLQELRAAKEQLEVHIQTIGILVSDKTELQESLRKTQKKLQSKESENEDVNNRLQAVRQRVVELERNVTNVQMVCDKYQQNNKELAQENEKIRNKVHLTNKEKEELSQQTSELQEMLKVKSSKCEALQIQVDEIRKKIADGNSQQISPDSEDSALSKLSAEKNNLEIKINQQAKLLEKLGAEKGEMLERHSEEIENLQIKLEEQRNLGVTLESQKSELRSQQVESQSLVVKLEKQIAEILDKEAEQQTSATYLAATEIDKINNEKQKLADELDIQITENRRISKLVLDQDERILELESAVARLGEDAVDRVSLLEDMQSDKETISRAMQQNKSLKDQLEELQNGFVKTTNTNATLTTELQKEQHLNKELASKLSEVGVELEEKKAELQLSVSTATSLKDQMDQLQSLTQNRATVNENENSELRLLVERLQADLEVQVQLNEKLRHLEAQSELTDKIHMELQSAQDTINLLSAQNSQLREALKGIEEERNAESKDVTMDEDDVDVVEEPEDHQEDEEDGYSNEDSHDDDRKNSDEEEHDKEKRSSITEEILTSYRNAIGQLEEDRDELYEMLDKERQDSAKQLEEAREHMEMQLQQQIKQQLRQVQEYYQQQIHEEQLRIQSLEEMVDNYKKQENLIQADINENGISFETLKIAFQQLQNRFKKLLDEKVSLTEKVQELEHSNMQLASETETISEYVNLYRTQRSALKDKFLEKDRVISQLSNEHGRMQAKVSQLQQLVMQTLNEKSGIEQEKKQMQELVNKRLAVQTGEERETEIPKLDLSNNSYLDETLTLQPSEGTEIETPLESTSRYRTESESSVSLQDGKAQQIMQIFEQLNDTGEGYQKGWLSPAVRRKEFTPCKHCSGLTISI